MQNLALVSKVEAMATEKGCTTGQLALAWLLAKGPFVYPIPGTKVRGFGELLAGAWGVTCGGWGGYLRGLGELLLGGLRGYFRRGCGRARDGLDSLVNCFGLRGNAYTPGPLNEGLLNACLFENSPRLRLLVCRRARSASRRTWALRACS